MFGIRLAKSPIHPPSRWPIRDGGVDLNRCRFSNVWFESVDPCKHWNHIQIVRIDTLEGWSVDISNCLMSCRVVTESWTNRQIRVLNHLHDLRDSSRSATGWRELLPHGGLGLESEHLREAVWPRSCGWGMSSDRRCDEGFRANSREHVYAPVTGHVSQSWVGQILTTTCA